MFEVPPTETVQPVRILLVDDHELTLTGLSLTLGNKPALDIVGLARSGREAVEKAIGLKPDIVLMDIRMPDINGIVATRLIKDKLPECKVIMLTSCTDPEEIEAAVVAHASAICHKDVSIDRLYQSILMVAEGGFWLDPVSAQTLLPQGMPGDFQKHDPFEFFNMKQSRKVRLLTQRETEIIQLVASGMNNKEIAMKLRITLATVKAHLTNIYHKMGVSDRTQVAIKVLQQGALYKSQLAGGSIGAN